MTNSGKMIKILTIENKKTLPDVYNTYSDKQKIVYY
jgi:hypothetical protein